MLEHQLGLHFVEVECSCVGNMQTLLDMIHLLADKQYFFQEQDCTVLKQLHHPLVF